MKQIDERDTMFARMARKEGTKPYEDYYQTYPEKKQGDDFLRLTAPMGGENAKFYHREKSALVDSTFSLLSDLKKLVEGPSIDVPKSSASSSDFTKWIKGITKLYGGVSVGITPFQKEYYYSQRGRTDEVYGETVKEALPHTIVFAVKMEQDFIGAAPTLPESIGVTKGYLDAAVLGLVLTYYIKALGYQARNHMDGNYLLVLPLAGKAAGLGDIGRNGLLITKEYGSMIRLGAVTTDLPLQMDSPSSFDIAPFCQICKKCSKFCPSKAIPQQDKEQIDGVFRWQISQEKCFSKWQQFGTDCGICLTVCPFSFPMEQEDVNLYLQNKDTASQIFEKYQKKIPSRPETNLPQWLK